VSPAPTTWSSSIPTALLRARSTQRIVRKLERTAPIARQRVEDFKDLVEKNFISKYGYLEKEQAGIEQQADLETQRRRLKAPARWRSDAAIPWRERVDAIGCLGDATNPWCRHEAMASGELVWTNRPRIPTIRAAWAVRTSVSLNSAPPSPLPAAPITKRDS
jgi:hypothetical protein